MLHRLRQLVIALALALPLFAQDAPDGKPLTVRAFVADTAAVEAGKPFRVVFHFKIAEKWHMYWRHPGGVGTPLTVVAWKLPPGWKAGEVEFPLPFLARNNEYDQNFYAYEHDVAFPVTITPPAKLTDKEVVITAKIEWQVCEATCIPGEAEMKLTLPVGTAKPANTESFTKWLGELPQTGEPPTKDITFDFKNKVLTVRATGLPADSKAEFFAIPPPAYSGGLDFGPAPKTETAPDGSRVFTFRWDQDIQWSGLLTITGPDGKRRGWYIGDVPPVGMKGKAAGTEEIPEDDGEKWDPFDDIAKAEAGKDAAGSGLWLLLLQGFLGGLLLNLMPCVLPVISIKIIGFVQQAQEDKRRVFHLGLAYCGGVFAFFLALAVIVLALASANERLGWGAQFSNPVLLTVMVAILFLFALSLFGIFEITLGGATSTKISEVSGKSGFGGAFMHGFFTTLIGTSCTAPLVGPVIGAAVNQPGFHIFALLGMVATGLALPYFLLTWKPAWMRFIPKPGTWMIRFKQLLGFVLAAFAVWLMSSLPTSIMVIAAAYFLIVLSVAAWLLGSYHEAKWRWPVVIALVVGGWWFLVSDTIVAPPDKPSGLVAKVRKGLNENRPVFVDFTADWCANCKVYERLVINTDAVQAAFKEKNVLFIKADYTLRPSDIDEALRKSGRAGVPLYVLFRKRGDYWLADGLTQGGLLEEIRKL